MPDHTFTRVLSKINADAIIAAHDRSYDSESPVTLATVGCLSLQTRILWDTLPEVDPGSPQELHPSLWQAIGLEVAIALYGDVLARDSVWGIWMWLGNRQSGEWQGFPDFIKSHIEDLASEAMSRVNVSIGQRLDRLQSARSLLLEGPDRPGCVSSICV